MCTKCKIEYPATTEYFVKYTRSKSGLGICKLCNNKRGKDYRNTNPKEYKLNMKRYALKRLGFTPELFDAMLEAQGNVCALCGTDTPAGRSDTFHADHNHKTGKARGVLCMSCNITIGHIEAKCPDWIDKAQKYINQGGFHTANSQEIVTQLLPK